MSTLSAPRTARAGVPVVRGRCFILVRDGLWRIVDPSGAVIGYIECHRRDDGDRYSARRIIFATRTRELGLFCRFDDAVDCFR